MARLGEIKAGFTFHGQKPKKKPQAKAKAKVGTLECQYCGARVTKLNKLEKAVMAVERADEEEFTCRECLQIVGYSILKGCTEEGEFSRIAEVGEAGWAMMLRVPSMKAPDGRVVRLDMGDILKVVRVGSHREGGPPDLKRSKDAWTIDVKLGPVTVTLWPHEFGVMQWAIIMVMRGAGEVVEQFVGADDDIGYFAPSKEMRAEIDACFVR